MLAQGTLVNGKYKILNEIERDDISITYLAIDEKADKTWAVKEIQRNEDERNNYNMICQSLIAERDALKNIKHPGLPSIVEMIDDGGKLIIIMDYVKGQPMDIVLEKKGSQPEECVKEWAKQLCDVLGYLHSQNPPIIYNNLKPSSIMLKPDGNISISDFGTAKKCYINSQSDETTACMTNSGYIAPEQYEDKGIIDERTDIYALGMTLYTLLTGIDPRRNTIKDKSIRKINPAFSRSLDRIIVKCMQDDANLRYQSCEKLMYDLEHIK